MEAGNRIANWMSGAEWEPRVGSGWADISRLDGAVALDGDCLGDGMMGGGRGNEGLM